jgi:hypothetical protein
MHFVLIGINLWAALFLLLALWLGWRLDPLHLRFGVFAASFATLAQCLMLALFMGTAKLVKKHVGLYLLPAALIDRLNRNFFRLLPLTLLGASWFIAAGVIGAMQGSGWIEARIHGPLALAGTIVFAALLPFELRVLRAQHRLLAEMEALLPPRPAGAAPSYPGVDPERPHLTWGKVRAVLWIVGLMGWLPLLSVSFMRMAWATDMLAPTLAVCLPCLIAAAALGRLRLRAELEGHSGASRNPLGGA